jgi:hypothetical protein
VIAGLQFCAVAERNVLSRLRRLQALVQYVPHDVESEEDSAFLLTLSWPAEEAGKCETDQAKND